MFLGWFYFGWFADLVWLGLDGLGCLVVNVVGCFVGGFGFWGVGFGWVVWNFGVWVCVVGWVVYGWFVCFSCDGFCFIMFGYVWLLHIVILFWGWVVLCCCVWCLMRLVWVLLVVVVDFDFCCCFCFGLVVGLLV